MIAGIPIRVHLTLALLLVWIAMTSMFQGLGPSETLAGLAIVIAVFAIIVVHELCHALVARRFGVNTRGILLLPIGGIATLERIPERPRHELAVALAGPAVNVLLAALLWLGLALAGEAHAPTVTTSVGARMTWELLVINLVLAGFNLVPAFPMDGGRALRALLAMRLGRARATMIASGMGKLFAIALAVIGLVYNPWLVVIAIVVWFGAAQEAATTRLRASLVDVPVSAAMSRQIDSVTPDESLEDAARLLVSTGQQQLPIVDRGEMVGVLTRADLAEGIAGAGARSPVGQAPRHRAVTVSIDDPLEGVFDQIVHADDAIAVVFDHGAPVGVVTAEQLATFASLFARQVAV